MKVEVNKLDGLSRIASGYSYDTVTGDVISTRQNKTGQKLYGSYNKGIKRYTLMLADGYKTGYCVSASVQEHALKSKAAMLTTSAKPSRIVANSASTIEKGWFIGTVNLGVLSTADHPKVHGTETSVKAEMTRLAKAYPGRTFVQLKIESFAKAGDVSWF